MNSQITNFIENFNFAMFLLFAMMYLYQIVYMFIAFKAKRARELNNIELKFHNRGHYCRNKK
ncbi:Cellulose synthase/poly-beta-1,6-N-acetylglucosamine synthase-like glycosyltransferase OS=Ureibacillus acetophenoni OX=614649 GN=SAMN05877842_108134 PE=3 SV=1 [Ureibacillus acetophenoni]